MTMTTETLDDFRTYVREILAAPQPPLPPENSTLGPVTATWFEVVDEPGVAVIITTGGTVGDRLWAERYLREQLRGHGYRQATIDMEGESLRRTATWDDIMAKAKRLIQSGQVTVGNNDWGSVTGHVIGDHGEYNCEFSREDPNSGVITQWQCECPWAQYAWGRTRQWKKYEGRVCAHVLALYWKARSTPLDGDHPSGQTPRGQMGPAPAPTLPHPGMPAQGPGEALPQAPVDLNQTPTQAPSQTPDQGPQMQLFDPNAAMPAASPPGMIPPFPGEQMNLFENYQGPGTTPAGGQSPPWAVSVPGAQQPSFTNPIQFPGGTYSRTAARDLVPGERVTLLEPEMGVAAGRDGAYDDGQWMEIPAGTPGQVFDFDPTTGLCSVLFELKGGAMSSYHVRCYLDRKQVRPVRGRAPLDPGVLSAVDDAWTKDPEVMAAWNALSPYAKGEVERFVEELSGAAFHAFTPAAIVAQAIRRFQTSW